MAANFILSAESASKVTFFHLFRLYLQDLCAKLHMSFLNFHHGKGIIRSINLTIPFMGIAPDENKIGGITNG